MMSEQVGILFLVLFVVAIMQIERWKQDHEQKIRLDVIQRSSAVTRGKVTEHIVPYLPGFDIDPKDIRFLGTPIDLIAFKGLNDSAEEVEIVFIEVKTGRSVLSAREKAVKKAVEEKKVSWRVFNPDVKIIPLERVGDTGAIVRYSRDEWRSRRIDSHEQR
jgi:predicted Holliday junction resolvase-like endonuclease